VSALASHWDFNRWKCGDGAAIALDDERAQIRPPFSYSRSRSMVRNAALAYWQNMSAAERATLLPTMIVTDPGSAASYGTRSWSAENLVVLEGTTTGLDASGECVLYATHIVDNYADPRNRINEITFKPLRPDDARADATWALLTRIDISDVLNVRIDHPGGGGFNEDFFVEGLRETYRPLVQDLDSGYPYVEMALNLSPASYWSESPFGVFS
jgi:hypothetical protein